MQSTDPLAILAAMRQIPTLKERMETALRSVNYPEHLKPSLRALLKEEGRLSVSYFVWAAERLLNKGTAIVQERMLLAKQQAETLKAALDLKAEFEAHLKSNPDTILAPAADLVCMFERHLAGRQVSNSPRCEEDLVLPAEKFLHLATPYTSLMKAERLSAAKVAAKQENVVPEMKVAA